MTAVDTNILVHAHRADSDWFEPAFESIRQLAEGGTPWAIPWPCIHEFYAVVTNLRVFRGPSTPAEACAQIDMWMESPSLRLIGEMGGYWPELKKLATSAKIVGSGVHDARIAAICLSHGVSELWSADRDFSRFPRLRIRNPLLRG
jgi:uncharacterized protein